MRNTQFSDRPRLLVISHLLLPDTCGGAAIFTDLCHSLVERGFDVTVRCSYPYYPEWKDKSGQNGVEITRFDDRGLKVERFGMFIPSNPRSVLQRLLYETSFFLSLCRSLVGDSKFNAVLVYCPLVGSVAYASLHKLIYRSPLFLNVQDLPADAAIAGGMARSGLFRTLLSGIQRFLFNQADVWSTISPVMMQRLETLRRRGQPIIFLPNWLHDSISQEINRQTSKVDRAMSDPVKLLYAGNIGGKQGLLEFCQVMSLTHAPFHFRIQGNGGAAGEVSDWIDASKDSRFTFGPILDEPGFVKALHETDFFVITEKSGSGASFFPSKTVPGLASGTPILAVSDPESPLGSEVRSQSLGVCLTWDQTDELGELIASLPWRDTQFVSWQQNAVDRSLYFRREYCVDIIESHLRAMIQGELPVGQSPLNQRPVIAPHPDHSNPVTATTVGI